MRKTVNSSFPGRRCYRGPKEKNNDSKDPAHPDGVFFALVNSIQKHNRRPCEPQIYFIF
jgi:hypothetical protein